MCLYGGRREGYAVRQRRTRHGVDHGVVRSNRHNVTKYHHGVREAKPVNGSEATISGVAICSPRGMSEASRGIQRARSWSVRGEDVWRGVVISESMVGKVSSFISGHLS